MFAIAVRIITSVLISASIFFHGATHGAKDHSDDEMKFRRVALIADVLSTVGFLTVGILTLNPLMFIAAGLSVVGLAMGLRSMKSSIHMREGSAEWSDVIEFATFQSKGAPLPTAA